MSKLKSVANVVFTWGFLWGVLCFLNLLGVLFTEGHTQIMSAVSFWGLLIAWKLDDIGDRQKRVTNVSHVYLSDGMSAENIEAAVRRAVRDGR